MSIYIHCNASKLSSAIYFYFYNHHLIGSKSSTKILIANENLDKLIIDIKHADLNCASNIIVIPVLRQIDVIFVFYLLAASVNIKNCFVPARIYDEKLGEKLIKTAR